MNVPRVLALLSLPLVSCSTGGQADASEKEQPAVAAPAAATAPAAAAALAAPAPPTSVAVNDSGLVYAPDSTLVAFVRTSVDRTITIDGADEKVIELWVARPDGSSGRRILESKAADDRRAALYSFEKLVFSNDGKRLYFLSDAWTTSGALHVVDIATRRSRYIAPANSILLLRSGQYAGCLVVSQHRYFLGSGSYDLYWMLAEDGDEIGLVSYDDPEHLRSQVDELLSFQADSGVQRSCASRSALGLQPRR